MAALLKKRALAEFTQVFQSDAVRPHKKLCLTRKPIVKKWQEITSNLSNEKLSGILSLSVYLESNMPTETDELAQIFKVLSEQLSHEEDPIFRAKLVSLIGKVGAKLDASATLDNITTLIKNETSHTVLAAAVDAVYEIASEVSHSVIAVVKEEDSNKRPILGRAMTVIKQTLLDTHHCVKCRCIRALARLATIDARSQSASKTHKFASGISDAPKPVISRQHAVVMRTICDHVKDQDPRVRQAAFEALLLLNDSDVPLDIGLYPQAIEALDDDFEGVRMIAIKIVFVLSQRYGSRNVDVRTRAQVSGPQQKQQICLVDDAFARVCQAIQDGSVAVRVEAATLLGDMQNVSPDFLHQTLDKKLMSNLRRKQTAHERQREQYESGEWSSGAKWADDSPREVVDADNVSLIQSGACGAFVHGLEDEFLEVRLASLDSLCRLAVKFPAFAALSLDFVVDMFNDEIEEVRLKGIRCLASISNEIVLREDQIDTILAVLKDFSMYTREALHEMLASCRLSTTLGLKSCIDSLLENLKRYPQDKRSIWRCLKRLGAKHPYLTLPLVPELLGIHPYFDLPEPEVEDPNYMSLLILVFNAAAHCPTMAPLFEEHTLRHYAYVRHSLPNMVPHIEFRNGGDTTAIVHHAPPAFDSNNTTITTVAAATREQHSRSLTQSAHFLQQVLDRLAQTEKRPPGPAQQAWLQTAVEDLECLANLEPGLSAAAQCAKCYIKCQLDLVKILSTKSWQTLGRSPQSGHLRSQVESLLRQTFALKHQFNGLTRNEESCIRQLWLRLLALLLVVIIRGSNTSALGLCDAFLDQLDRFQTFLEENNCEADSFTMAMFRELSALQDPKPGSVARVVQPLFSQHVCPPLRILQGSDWERIKRATATMYEPSGDADLALKCTAGLVAAVQIDAELENVADIKRVRIKVRYPDKQVHLILPRQSDFREQNDDSAHHRLYTTTALSHGVWSEPLHVEMSLVLDFSDAFSSTSTTRLVSGFGLKPEDLTIDLCPPVKVLLHPRPMKKGL